MIKPIGVFLTTILAPKIGEKIESMFDLSWNYISDLFKSKPVKKRKTRDTTKLVKVHTEYILEQHNLGLKLQEVTVNFNAYFGLSKSVSVVGNIIRKHK